MTLENVNPGDLLYIWGGPTVTPSLRKVDSVTPTGIVVISPGFRFNRNGKERRGQESVWYAKHARPATPEDIAKVTRARQVEMLQRLDWSLLPDEKLAAVMKVVGS